MQILDSNFNSRKEKIIWPLFECHVNKNPTELQQDKKANKVPIKS